MSDERRQSEDLQLHESCREEISSLREKNSELVLEVQRLKMMASQKEKDRQDLQTENNLLRQKISRMRHTTLVRNTKLDKQMSDAETDALRNIVQASGCISRCMELRKMHMRHYEELDQMNERACSGSPSRVGRIPPQSFRGQCIQPVVSLSRTLPNTSARSSNQNHPQRERAAIPLSINLLQDLYIPLPRIDMADLTNNSLEGDEDEGNDPDEDMSLPDVADENNQEDSHVSESGVEEYQGLDVVMEEVTPAPTPTSRSDDLRLYLSPSPPSLGDRREGPRGLPDEPGGQEQENTLTEQPAIEADSTTRCHLAADEDEDAEISLEAEDRAPSPIMTVPFRTPLRRPAVAAQLTPDNQTPRAFTPTMRRRIKRTPRPYSPRPSIDDRVLKVVLQRISFEDVVSPPVTAPENFSPPLTAPENVSPPVTAPKSRNQLEVSKQTRRRRTSSAGITLSTTEECIELHQRGSRSRSCGSVESPPSPARNQSRRSSMSIAPQTPESNVFRGFNDNNRIESYSGATTSIHNISHDISTGDTMVRSSSRRRRLPARLEDSIVQYQTTLSNLSRKSRSISNEAMNNTEHENQRPSRITKRRSTKLKVSESDDASNNQSHEDLTKRERIKKRRSTTVRVSEDTDDDYISPIRVQLQRRGTKRSNSVSQTNDLEVAGPSGESRGKKRSKSANRENRGDDGVHNRGKKGKAAKRTGSRRGSENAEENDGPSLSRNAEHREPTRNNVQSVSCRDSDSETSSLMDTLESRRRQRKPATYKEIPLNRKMRR